jgi:hypothetical protein
VVPKSILLGFHCGIFILEVFQFHLEYLYWRASSANGMFILEVIQCCWNIYTGGHPVQFGIFILEIVQCHLEYLNWRSSSAIGNIYTGGHPVPFGIFILEIVQCH